MHEAFTHTGVNKVEAVLRQTAIFTTPPTVTIFHSRFPKRNTNQFVVRPVFSHYTEKRPGQTPALLLCRRSALCVVEGSSGKHPRDWFRVMWLMETHLGGYFK